MTETVVATAFWRRLDTEGHDCCALVQCADGWRLDGRAVFLHGDLPCALAYRVHCDTGWRTRRADIDGSVGFERLSLDIRQTGADAWTVNGTPQPEAAGCIDLDLGFTPATNLIAIRRLQPGADADTEAVAAYYLEFSQALGRIAQTYRRTSETTLGYAAPGHEYRAKLVVARSGFVRHYPGLWTGEISEI